MLTFVEKVAYNVKGAYMQDEKRKISKLKALIIKEQKLLLDLIATTARADKKAVDQTADTPDFLDYNTLLARQLQLLSRLFNQQTKKQTIIAHCQEEKANNSIRIDNLDVEQYCLQGDIVEPPPNPTISRYDDSIDEQEDCRVDALDAQSDSKTEQSHPLDHSRPNIR